MLYYWSYSRNFSVKTIIEFNDCFEAEIWKSRVEKYIIRCKSFV